MNNKIPLKLYSEIHNRNYPAVFAMVRKGRISSAEKIGGRWYIDPNEAYPSQASKRKRTLSEPVKGKISLQEYADLKNRKEQSVLAMISQGKLETAEKIGGRWYIDPNEPYPSESVKGKIPLKEYAQQQKRLYKTVIAMVYRGKFNTAEKIGKRWCIDPNEAYPSEPVKGKISLKEYAEQQNRKYTAVFEMARKGKFNTAEQLEGRWWHINANEPYPTLPPESKISLKEYAKQQNRKYMTVQRMIRQGMLTTAEKIKNRWCIDPNEPYPCSSLQAPQGKIPLQEYADLKSRKRQAVLAMVKKGRISTAEKIENRWYIDPNEPYPISLPPESKVSLKEYAGQQNQKYRAVLKMVRQGMLTTAEKIGERWYIAPNEPYLYSSSEAPQGKIPLKEYAKQQNRKYETVHGMIRRGLLTTAEKIGGRWYISPNEPYHIKFPQNKIPLKEYAVQKNQKHLTVLRLARMGEFKTAELVGERWFVAPDEPYPMDPPENKIPLKEYAQQNYLSYNVVYMKVRQGYFMTAEKVGKRWYVDSNEPYYK